MPKKEKIVLDRLDFKFKLGEKSLVAQITFFSPPPSSCNYGDFVLWVLRQYRLATKIQVESHDASLSKKR